MRSLSNQGPRVLIWHAYSYYKAAFRDAALWQTVRVTRLLLL